MALTLVRKDWLWVTCPAVDAMEGIVHLIRDPANTVLKPLEKVLELLVVATDGLLGVPLDLVRRDLVASLWATQLEYSRQTQKQIASTDLEHCRGRAIAVRAWRLRQSQLPGCSSLAKGCASSLV